MTKLTTGYRAVLCVQHFLFSDKSVYQIRKQSGVCRRCIDGSFECYFRRHVCRWTFLLLSYANQYTKPFNEISGVITELQNALACAARIFELIEEDVEIPDDADAVILDQVEGKVTLKDVDFSYLPEQKLIEHLNLDVKPGQTIAIVGPTGCGKRR